MDGRTAAAAINIDIANKVGLAAAPAESDCRACLGGGTSEAVRKSSAVGRSPTAQVGRSLYMPIPPRVFE